MKFDSPSGELNGAQSFLSIVWKFWLLQLTMWMVVYKQKILFVNWFILFQQLLSGYKTRDQAIKKCITLVSENAKQLRERNEKNPDDFQIMKDLRKEQTKVKIMCTRSRKSIRKFTLQVSTELCYTRIWVVIQSSSGRHSNLMDSMLDSGSNCSCSSASIVVLHSWARHNTLINAYHFGPQRQVSKILISRQVQYQKSAIV